MKEEFPFGRAEKDRELEGVQFLSSVVAVLPSLKTPLDNGRQPHHRIRTTSPASLLILSSAAAAICSRMLSSFLCMLSSNGTGYMCVLEGGVSSVPSLSKPPHPHQSLQ